MLGRPDHPGSGGRFGLQWVHFDADCALFLADSDHGHGDAGHRARFRWHHPLLWQYYRLRYARRELKLRDIHGRSTPRSP